MAYKNQVKVKIINAHLVSDPENPTLKQWAGIENGDILYGEMYANKSVNIEAPKNHYTEEFGTTKKGDWTELLDGEYEVIE